MVNLGILTHDEFNNTIYLNSYLQSVQFDRQEDCTSVTPAKHHLLYIKYY